MKYIRLILKIFQMIPHTSMSQPLTERETPTCQWALERRSVNIDVLRRAPERSGVAPESFGVAPERLVSEISDQY